ncbi:MAG: HEAT repeat domain-containing protein [Acidobacteriota bacterium]
MSGTTEVARRRLTRAALLGVVIFLSVACAVAAQEPAAPQAVSAAQLQAAIDKLGNLDYATRTTAARTIRRTPGSQAVPALLQAVGEHADGYVRYRALVLLTGFNDPRTKDAMRESVNSPNDRLRTVAYSFFEHSPDPALVASLLAAFDKEQAEFVRPALIRALAVAVRDLTASAPRADITRAQQALVVDVSRGEDFFRSVVIEALGDYKASYAFDAITAVAKLNGPLQDDAALALGKIGDKRALATLAGLQRTAPRASQSSIAAAICLLDVNCGTHEGFIAETLAFADKNPGFQELLRGAAAGLGALAVAGHAESLNTLFRIGIPATDDATRAPVALAVAAVALRNTALILPWLEKAPNQAAAIALLAEGIEMLEEDLDKERFFALTRRLYWDAPEKSPTRALAQTLIGKLDF